MNRFHVLFASVLLMTGLVLATLSAQASTDVVPGQTGFEPTTSAVNPRNPSQVVVMRGCTARISNDYGQTFPITRNTTVTPCNGDPAIAFDSQGRLFVTHLTTTAGELLVLAGQIADTTTTGTQTYTPIQVSATDGNADDKQWLVADANPNSPFRDNLYLVWTDFGGNTSISFSRSEDGGANWSAPSQISAAGEGFVWPAHIAVAINGDVYVAYHTDTCGAANSGNIPLLRDGNGGADFAAATVNQKNDAFADGQATITCNVIDGSGDEIPNADFWLQGSVQPWILPDPSNAANVYVVGNDDPNNTFGNGDDADVVIARSTNFGASFSVSRVDDGPGQSFAVMPTAAIDQDGNIVTTWYDNRNGNMNTGANSNNGAANFLLDLYGTTSRDGGVSFVNDFQINDSPFDPDVSTVCRFGSLAGNNCTHRIGEYNGISTVDAIGYAVWTGNATPPVAPFPSDATGAQTTLFDLFSMAGAFPDRLEPNESKDFAVVATLGANDTYAESDLTLHSATDIDFFKVTALHTGKLDVKIEFNEVIAGLEVRIQDTAGNILATGTLSTATPGSSVESLTIPVVQGREYFVEVFDPAPATIPPQSTYDLTIVNRAAPVPFALDLLASSDSGRIDSDDVTNDTTPTIQIRVDENALAGLVFSPTADGILTDDAPGFKVRVFNDGVSIGFATQSSPGVYQFTASAGSFNEGLNSVTARVIIVDPSDTPAVGTLHAFGQGGESNALQFTLDTTAPATPGTPDLQTGSDNAGINDDNITTIQSPTFTGFGESNALVRLFANGDQTAEGLISAAGNYQRVTGPFADGVYDITASLEDLAGNLSAESAALQVTIAHQTLLLPGLTTGAPVGPVVVDLDDGTISGYPGVAGATGEIGVVGIPTVSMAMNGQTLTILGTAGDDDMTYAPTSATGGRLTRAGSGQTLLFSGASSPLTIDPGAGTDSVTTLGTTNADTVTASITTNSSVQVGSLLTAVMPTANVERIGISTGQAADTINVTVFDTVNANLLVDAGAPSTTKPNADTLTVFAGSPQASLQKQPGGPAPASGSIFVTYPKTTTNQTRIDYLLTEKIVLKK